MKKLTKKEMLAELIEFYGDTNNIINQARDAMFDGIDDGWCVYCGEQHDSGVEPDASNYFCYHCDQPGVKAVGQLIFEGLL